MYDSPSGSTVAYPVIVAHIPDTAAEVFFAALVDSAAQGRANPFVVVVQPRCGLDDSALLSFLDAHYRTVRHSRARGVLGIGPTSSCVLASALRQTSRYRSGVALASADTEHTDAATGFNLPELPARSRISPRPHLLLASLAGDVHARRDAVRLRAALAPFTHTRIVDTVHGGSATARQAGLFRIALQYFTEQLSGPSRLTRDISPAAPPRSDVPQGRRTITHPHSGDGW